MQFPALAVAAVLLLAQPLAGSAHERPDTLGKIRAARTINVAYSADSLPFSFTGEGGRPDGYSIDLCRKVIAAVGRSVGQPDLKVNWIAGTVAERLAMIASGRADLDCANTSTTFGRMQDVDFSGLVFVDGGGLMIRASGPASRLADLAGRRIAVIAGTTTEQRLHAVLKQRVVNATVVLVRDGNEGLALLEAGSVDALASDKIKLAGLAAQAKDPTAFALLAEDLSFEPYAFAVPRNDSAFRVEVNRALAQTYAGGDIDAIFSRWLGKLGRPSGLLAAMYLLNAVPD
jgi:ABC-type amino acid transport substrate-binding protein